MNIAIDTAGLARVAQAAGRAALPGIEGVTQAALTAVAAGYGLGFLPGMVLPALFAAINRSLGLPADAPPDVTAAKIEDDPDAARTALSSIDQQQQLALDQQKQADDTRLASQAQQTALVALDTAAQDRVQRWWRPMIGWGLGGLVLGSYALPYPVWLLACFGLHLPAPPQLAPEAVGILTALLGVTVAARSADKVTQASAVKAVTAAVRR